MRLRADATAGAPNPMTHYIHRPTPEGGETDPRFRTACAAIVDTGVEIWNVNRRSWALHAGSDCLWLKEFDVWRIPGSDAPSKETLALAEDTKCKT